jgi:Uma2 family endonuclease
MTLGFDRTARSGTLSVMAAAQPYPSSPVRPGEHVPTADQRVVVYGVSWAHYETHLAMRGERAVPRIAYLRGTLELMSPSRDHERITSWIGRLIEVYAEERDIQLAPYRSWTLKHPEQAGAEPDECYLFGADETKDRPDLVIEVVWTSGGVDKLEIYRALGIAEVWFWIHDRIEVHALHDGRYERVDRSHWLPALDLVLLCSFLDRPFVDAKREFRAALRNRP